MGVILDVLLIIVVVILCIIRRPSRYDRYRHYPPSYDYLYKRSSRDDFTEAVPAYEVPVREPRAREQLPIKGAYQRSWVFTQNEKAEYRKLKPIAEQLGYIVLTKVRLLDLLEPRPGSQKHKTYFYKVQAKHIDFVLCDQEKLVARVLIELDDSSHDQIQRKERDEFVDQVVQSVGYKIIHTRRITEELREQLLALKGEIVPEKNELEEPCCEILGEKEKAEEI